MKAAIYATIIAIGELQAGKTAEEKEWEKRQVVIIPQDSEKKIAVDFFGKEKVKAVEQFKVGEKALVTFDVYSREYNGKYYTQCDGWKIDSTTAKG